MYFQKYQTDLGIGNQVIQDLHSLKSAEYVHTICGLLQFTSTFSFLLIQLRILLTERADFATMHKCISTKSARQLLSLNPKPRDGLQLSYKSAE